MVDIRRPRADFSRFLPLRSFFQRILKYGVPLITKQYKANLLL